MQQKYQTEIWFGAEFLEDSVSREKGILGIFFAFLVLLSLAACSELSGLSQEAPAESGQAASEPALKSITVSAAEDDGPIDITEKNEPASEGSDTGTGALGTDPTRVINLPVVISDEGGIGLPTATATAVFFTPPPSASPTMTPTSGGSGTATPTLTPPPQGSTGTPTVTATQGPVDTTTPTASGTPKPTATETSTPNPAASFTPTPTSQVTATPTATATLAAQHFVNCAYRTGTNATVAVPNDVEIIGGLLLEVSDEVAVFTPDGSICAGVTLWTGENIAVTAWGDDSQTPEQDGLVSGDEMRFKIWDASAGLEYQVSSVSYSMGNGIFTVDSVQVISSMTVSSS